MALGNNLKRIKKDSLIPSQKERVVEAKLKKVVKEKAKTVKKIISKSKPVAAKQKVKVAKKTSVKVSNKQVLLNKPTETAHLDERILVGGKKDSAITIKLIPSRRKTVRKTRMIFEGSLSLLEAETIKKGLLSTFNDFDIIDIQLLNITHLDIIPVQLFKLFINFYTNKKVKIDSDMPFDMKIIIERAGFGSFMFKEKVA